MSKKTEKVHLKLNIPPGFNINITLDGKTYHVQTEDGGKKNPLITTHIYHKGQIVYSGKTECSDITDEADFESKLKNLMDEQHRSVINEFTRKYEENKLKTEYFEAVKKLLMRRNNRQALKILEDAMIELPDDPFIMSYYGYLKAIVEKKYDEGIKICKKVLEKIDHEITPEEKSLYAAFYLNLGKAYLAAGQRKSAMDAFNDGLKVDNDNHDILWETKKLGSRKKPVVPFLSRGNPINKYIGLLISKLRGK